MRRALAFVVLGAPLLGAATMVACGASTGNGSAPSSDASDDVTTGNPPGSDAAGEDALATDSGLDAGPDVGAAQCVDFNPDKNVYWGDLHTHTALSGDAYGWGNRNFPHDAYRFASDPSALTPIAAGAPTPGPLVSIDRALDWDAVTDHSEWLGATWGCGVFPDGGAFNPASPYLDSLQCQNYRDAGGGAVAPIIAAADQVISLECDGGLEADPACRSFTQSAWQLEIQAAHDAYQPCTFTPLVAYEWTKAENGATLHQNVIFSSESVPAVPLDSAEYTTTGDLWSGLDQQCVEDAGCQVLTIPHNPNLSEGLAYQIPPGVDAREQMNHYQRLTEIHQHKGNSECYAGDAAPDPTCNFEHVPAAGGGSEYPQNFVRHALAEGIVTYAAMRDAGEPPVDPMQMGIEGATDDHNGIPGYVTETTWQGHVGSIDDTPAGRLAAWYHNPGGLTGAWAEQNTRDAIFAALQRRETFATSGPRIVVRFYEVGNTNDYCGVDGGGGGFPGNVIAAGGVPMGGTMAAGSAAANFVVSALKDDADLAEVDIIRGAIVAGTLAETVTRFTPSSAGSVWSGGSVCVQWSDPGFDPSGPAFYYVRVLQAPTWRWSHYDCQVDPSAPACAPDGGVDVMIQERAWSSPIWWLP
ncbi:MAG: DUF3604 domain-containing protein [Polyangiaceae bacterium]